MSPAVDPKTDPKELWNLALAQLEVKLDNPTHFRTWFVGTKLLELEANRVLIGVRNFYTADWLRRKHQDIIESTVNYIFGGKKKVEYKIADELANEPVPTISNMQKPPVYNPSLLDVTGGNSADLSSKLVQFKLNPKYSFESFVEGSSNQMAFAAAQAVVEKPGEIYNPFFIYGKTGLGKTHVAHAIARRILERNLETKIMYVPAETFLNEMVNAIKSGRTKMFRDKYRDRSDVLIIDDIQFISDWERTQTEFFNTFNVLQAANKQIIIISDRSPDELENLTPRLKSRFQGGIVVDVARPDFEHRLAILERKLPTLGLGANVSREIMTFIAKNITDNIRELEGALQKAVLMINLSPTKQVSIEEVAVQIGKDAISKRSRVSISQVLKTLAQSFEIKVSDIKGDRRTKDIALARQVAMYILREEFNYKLEEIARSLNRKDHTTVMHGIDKIKSLRNSDEGFRTQLTNIIEELN